MKRTPVLFAVALSLAPVLVAQEAAPANSGRLQIAPANVPASAPADTPSVTITPSATPAPAPSPLPEVTLIPEQVPQTPKATPEEKKSKTAENEEQVTELIHFRQARIKALRDLKVQAEWDRSNRAKTDYERREALKSYYNLLYAKILTIDASVKKTADLRKTNALHRLDQTRIDPTEPLDPTERAEQFRAAQ